MYYLYGMFLIILCIGSASAIVGGTTTTIEEAPFIVWLYSLRTNVQYCAGTIYQDKYVVTSAHCSDIPLDKLVIHGNTSFRNESGIIRQAVKIHIHPKWINTTSVNDIAVIELNEPFGGATKSLPLCKKQIKDDQIMTIYGWGDQFEGSQQGSDQLRKTTVAVVSEKVCQKSYDRQNATISPDMFCMSADGRDACLSDSGGPAVYNGELCGVISWGQGCAEATYPGVYSNVYHFRSFINNFVNNQNKKKSP